MVTKKACAALMVKRVVCTTLMQDLRFLTILKILRLLQVFVVSLKEANKLGLRLGQTQILSFTLTSHTHPKFDYSDFKPENLTL